MANKFTILLNLSQSLGAILTPNKILCISALNVERFNPSYWEIPSEIIPRLTSKDKAKGLLGIYPPGHIQILAYHGCQKCRQMH